ncbi:SubName: Full=Granulin-like protein {ECO:0000313/EMBL:ACN66790.1} [Serendipita indica DSM 11827]|nr:SubName: Full=Granulin-like protein {ECO:0000313/EMBL:ACN66790.1} [Serendipita indica DSM 11827]
MQLIALVSLVVSAAGICQAGAVRVPSTLMKRTGAIVKSGLVARQDSGTCTTDQIACDNGGCCPTGSAAQVDAQTPRRSNAMALISAAHPASRALSTRTTSLWTSTTPRATTPRASTSTAPRATSSSTRSTTISTSSTTTPNGANKMGAHAFVVAGAFVAGYALF